MSYATEWSRTRLNGVVTDLGLGPWVKPVKPLPHLWAVSSVVFQWLESSIGERLRGVLVQIYAARICQGTTKTVG